MNYNTVLTFTQSLQLVALAPCFLVIVHLASSVASKKLIVVPILYFLSLSYGFIYYLIPAFHQTEDIGWTNFILLFGESFIPSLSFLLIYQFLSNKMPPAAYWSVVLIPILATSPFVYNAVFRDELCLTTDICFSSSYAMHLNNVVFSAFIFMLITFLIARLSPNLDSNKIISRHKYALIITLIIFNLLLLGLDLKYIQEAVDNENYIFFKTLIKLSFIYIVISSIFRVFSDIFDISPEKLSTHKIPLDPKDMEIALRAEKLLREEKVYREMGFNRASFAEKLGVKEHQLSRIINLKFDKSFSEIANEYRMVEAKELLSQTDMPVTTISFDIGFNSITSFNRVFKTMVGSSPSGYREESKKEEKNK